jgi:hypothetical protein
MNPMNLQSEKSLPEGMTIERNSGEIAIEIYDIPLRTPRLMMLWGTPLIILVIASGILGYLFMSGQLRQPDRFVKDLPLVIGIFLIVVPILLYFTSSRGRNKTRITKHSGKIEILYGPVPVPWRPRARSFPVNEITQIDHADETAKYGVLRNISLVLRDATKFSIGRWPIPVAETIEQHLRSMIG